MKRQKGFIQLSITLAIAVCVLVLGIIGYWSLKKYQTYQTEKTEKEKLFQELVQAQQKSLENAQKEINILKTENEQSKVRQKHLEQKLNKEKNKSTNNEIDLVSIIKEWQPRVPYVSCTFLNTENGILIQSGSGLFIDKNFNDAMSAFVFTNKHVVLNQSWGKNWGPSYCDFIFPSENKTIRVQNEAVHTDNIRDVAFIDIPNSKEVSLLPPTPQNLLCSQTASIGDKILILGYPEIGSPTGITATEGIISGYDGIYYVTSAKIDHGNSGGVAILEKGNCDIGIPTEAVSGSIESLGRILDMSKALDMQ